MSESKEKKKFIIIDGNALLHRAWHALPPLTSPKGHVVNALYGFTSLILKTLREMQPDYMAVAWDRKEPTFRHKEYKQYKAQREAQPDEFYAQLDPVKQFLKILGTPSLELPGFEADDIIATLVSQAEKNGETENIILTGDMDALQLVGKNTSVLTLKKGITDTMLYNEGAVIERYGLRPDQIIDFKALRGDPSDNIPGVKGIGEKGATELLQKFGNIEDIYKHLDACDKKKTACKIRDGLVKILRAGREAAKQSKYLVTLVRDLQIPFTLEEGKVEPPNREALLAFLAEYGFKTLFARIEKDGNAPAADEAGGAAAQGDLFGARKEIAKTYKLTEVRNTDEVTELVKKIQKLGQCCFKIVYDNSNIFTANIVGVAIAVSPDAVFLVSPTVGDLQKIFSDSKILKIAHGSKEDYKILRQNEGDLSSPIFDCMIASYVLNPGTRSHDVASLALRFLGESVLETEDAREVAAQTVRAAAASYEPLQKEIKTQNLAKFLDETEFPLALVLGRMELAGILIDADFLGRMSKDVGGRLAKLGHTIHTQAGTEFNINSPQQLADVLFNRLKLVPKTGRLKRGKTGISTAAAELEKLRGAHPMIDLLFEHRELSKLKSTYIDALPGLVNSKTGRVHTTFNQTITATGRLSSSDPNLQNIPIRGELGREVRKAFIAPKGFSLIAADYSQFELRIAASISNDQGMIEAFRAGADIHSATASEVWGISKGKVTPEMRRAAKAINFGITYGMGSTGLAVSAGISGAEAKNFIAKYFEAYPGIKKYIEETKALARSLGYVETLFGRRRYLPEIVSELPEVRAQAERMAVNMPIQGSQADMIKIAMVRLDRALGELSPKTKMILQVHDELVFEVPNGDVQQVAPVIREIMEGVYKLKVPIIVDVKVGKNWGEMATLGLAS